MREAGRGFWAEAAQYIVPETAMCLGSGSGSKERADVATAECEDKVLKDELGE